MPPREGVGLCKISLLEFEFDADELDWGDDGIEVKVEGSGNRLLVSAHTESVAVWGRSLVRGSDGVW